MLLVLPVSMVLSLMLVLPLVGFLVVEAIFAAVVVVASMQDIILSIFSHEEGKQEAF